MLVFEFKGLFLIHGGKSDFTKKKSRQGMPRFQQKIWQKPNCFKLILIRGNSQ